MRDSARRAPGTGSVRERGPGRWQLQWYAGRDAEGRPRYRTRTVSADSREDAERQLVAVSEPTTPVAAPTSPTPVPRGVALSVGDVLDQYAVDREQADVSPPEP
jgi:hypothetical protein